MNETIKEIPLDELHPFPDHPFGVRDDEAMAKTVESIREYGVLVPAIARPREEGGYTLPFAEVQRYKRQQAPVEPAARCCCKIRLRAFSWGRSTSADC